MENVSFASLPENHDLIFEYMRLKKLDAETFYDELVIDYLTAIKKICDGKARIADKIPI